MKYLKLFENYHHLDDTITKIQLLDSEDDEKIDDSKKQQAIEIIKNQYELNSIIPYFVAPTVNMGVLLEYSRKPYNHKDLRIDIRVENTIIMTVFSNGQLLYNGDFNQDKFNSYL